MRAALAPYLQGKHMGRNDFEGFCSERVYALLAKDPALALLVEHPRLLSIVDRLLAPHYLLSAFLAINVHPGETPQGWHFDDGGCHVPLPRPMHGVSAIWALDDFTTENGATQVIPRSHLWGDDAPAPDGREAVSICMPAGSVVVLGRDPPASRRSEPGWRYPSRCHAPVLPIVAAPDREHGARGAAAPGAWPVPARAGVARLQHRAALHGIRERPPSETADRSGRPPERRLRCDPLGLVD